MLSQWNSSTYNCKLYIAQSACTACGISTPASSRVCADCRTLFICSSTGSQHYAAFYGIISDEDLSIKDPAGTVVSKAAVQVIYADIGPWAPDLGTNTIAM